MKGVVACAPRFYFADCLGRDPYVGWLDKSVVEVQKKERISVAKL